MTDGEYAALYLRASLDATGEELSVIRQDEDGQKYIGVRGWRLFRVYIDNDVSAKGDVERPQFEAMIRDYLAGHFRIIVARNMDRLTRNRRDRLRVLELGEQRGMLLGFWRASDLDLSTPSGRLTADILASIARHEIEEMGDRRKRANLQKAEMGLPLGGKRPFGYCQHPKDLRTGTEVSRTCRDPGCPGSMRSLVPAEADTVRWCADQVVAGRGLWWLVTELERRGVVTTQGNPWRHSELRRMLTNPRIAGRRIHKGVDMGEAAWPAILDADTFAAVRAVLSDPSRARKGAPRRYFLSGLARCGACGEVVYGSPVDSRPVYTCSTRRHVAVKTGPVDAWVVELLAAWVARPDAVDRMAPAAARDDVAALRSREADLTGRKAALAEAFAAGEIDRAQLAAASARIRSELEDVTGRLSRAVSVPRFAELLRSQDAAGKVREMYSTDLGSLRDLLDTVAVVRLFSPGRGARVFRRESVEVAWR